MAEVLPVVGVRPLPLVEDPDGRVTLYRPDTGEELHTATATIDDLARLHELVREYARLAGVVRRQIDREFELRRRETAGSAARIEGDRLAAKRTVTRVWDADRTREALSALAADGTITDQEARALLPAVLVDKPDGRALSALLTRLLDDEHLEDAALLRAARDERVTWKIEQLPPETC